MDRWTPFSDERPSTPYQVRQLSGVFLKERGTESWGVLSLLIYMHIRTFFTFFPKAHYRGWQRHDCRISIPLFCFWVVETFEGPKRFGFYFHVLRVRRVTSCSPKRKPGSFQSFQILYLTLRLPVNTKGTEKTQGFPTTFSLRERRRVVRKGTATCCSQMKTLVITRIPLKDIIFTRRPEELLRNPRLVNGMLKPHESFEKVMFPGLLRAR